ncbi:unnamed protein product, partial [Rotaria sp. Silwood2]
EFSKYCIQLKKSKHALRHVFREKLKNDLEFRHYFQIFLSIYKKNLFQLILNELNLYIPKSKLFLEACCNDLQYNLFNDIEQLHLIYQFLKGIYKANDWKPFKVSRIDSDDKDDQLLSLNLGSNSARLAQRINNIEDYDQNDLDKHDFILIGKNAVELNNVSRKIKIETEPIQTISLGDNLNTLQNQLSSIKIEEKNLLDIKLNIGNNLKVLNEKFNSLAKINVDNDLEPVIGSRINQLSAILAKIKSTMNDSISTDVQLADNFYNLQVKLNSFIESNVSTDDFMQNIGTNIGVLE